MVIHTVHLKFTTILNGDNELFHSPCKMSIFCNFKRCNLYSQPSLVNKNNCGHHTYMRMEFLQRLVMNGRAVPDIYVSTCCFVQPRCSSSTILSDCPHSFFCPNYLVLTHLAVSSRFSPLWLRLAACLMVDMGFYTPIVEEIEQNGSQFQFI